MSRRSDRIMTSLPLGVCVLGEAELNKARASSYPKYVFEVLAHAGVFHAKLEAKELEAALDGLRILVTVGEGTIADSLKKKLSEWVEAGGSWINIAGIEGLQSLLGVERVGSTFKNWGGGMRSLGEGYLVAQKSDHPMLAHLTRPLHYFGGATIEAKDAQVLATAQDAHGRDAGHPVLTERAIGNGRCIFIAPDLTGTIVHIQQGHGVTRDGVPSPDGTSPVNDGVLKSDDGAVLDWIFDREAVAGAEGLQIFMQPVADLWREMLLRSIFYCAEKSKASLPVLWYWPRQLPAVGHLSHDTDGNDPKLMATLLETLAKGEVNSTWCVILPGDSPELMAKIKQAGHEYATHFDTMTPGHHFTEAEFDRQFTALKKLFNGEQPVTNKNHYLRWEGDCELWDWCVKHGIQLDQSKGASKTGEAGFNFGTCHPYFPVRFDGGSIDVLEMPTPTQDLVVFAPEAICEPLILAAKKVHGVAHFLFHPAHFQNPAVPKAMLHAIRFGKEQGLEWWTARQINAWERARRTACVRDVSADGFTISADAELPHATILWSGGGKLQADGKETAGTMQAWGFDFAAVTATIRGELRCRLG